MRCLAVLLALGCLLLHLPGTWGKQVALCQNVVSVEMACSPGQLVALTRSALFEAELDPTPTTCSLASAPTSTLLLRPLAVAALLTNAGVNYSMCSMEPAPCTASVDWSNPQQLSLAFGGSSSLPYVLGLQYECLDVSSTMQTRNNTGIEGVSVYLGREASLQRIPAYSYCTVCAFNDDLEQLKVSVLHAPLSAAAACSLTLEDEVNSVTLDCHDDSVRTSSVLFTSAGPGLNVTITAEARFDDRIWLNITGARRSQLRLQCSREMTPCSAQDATSTTAGGSIATTLPSWERREVVFNADSPSQLLACNDSQHIALTDATFNEESCASFEHRLPSLHGLVVASLLERVIRPCSFKLGVCNVSLADSHYRVHLPSYHPEAQSPAIRLALGYQCVEQSSVATPGDGAAVYDRNVYMAFTFKARSRKTITSCAACASSFYDRIRVRVLDIPKASDEECTLTLSEDNRTMAVGCADRTLMLEETLYMTLSYKLILTLTHSENFSALEPLWLNITSELGKPLQLWCLPEEKTADCPTLFPTTPFLPSPPASPPNSSGEVSMAPAPSGMRVDSILGICSGSAIFIVIVISVTLVVRNKIKNNRKSTDANPHANPDDDDDEDEDSDDVEAPRRPGTAAAGGRPGTAAAKPGWMTQGPLHAPRSHLAPLDHAPQRKKRRKKREFKRPMRDPFHDPKPPAPRPVPAALLPKAPLPGIGAPK